MHKMRNDLDSLTHTNHSHLGIPSGAGCRDGKSNDQQFVHDDCSVDEPQLYESELRAFNCSLVGVEVTDITGILQKVNSFQNKLLLLLKSLKHGLVYV